VPVKRLVIASNNPGKLREIGAILAPLSIDVVAQGELGVTEAEEPHVTFIENALAKARHASLITGLPSLADDSGVCVPALGGAPGVRSARYAHASADAADRETQDRRNNDKLLAQLHGSADRRAHYCCVMVLLRHADDPQPVIAEAEWHGEILHAPRGAGGFGYDPLFYLPDLGKTGAELTPAEKNRLSHRGRALAALFKQLQQSAGL